MPGPDYAWDENYPEVGCHKDGTRDSVDDGDNAHGDEEPAADGSWTNSDSGGGGW
jgi:hypothetical protein